MLSRKICTNCRGKKWGTWYLFYTDGCYDWVCPALKDTDKYEGVDDKSKIPAKCPYKAKQKAFERKSKTKRVKHAYIS